MFSFIERGLLVHLSDLDKQENSRKELRALVTTLTCLGLNGKIPHLDVLYYVIELLVKRDVFCKIKDFDWRNDACQIYNRGMIFGIDQVKETVIALLKSLLDEISRIM